MDAYERCSTHGLRKCAVCDRPAKPGAEHIATTVFPPEMLDGPTLVKHSEQPSIPDLSDVLAMKMQEETRDSNLWSVGDVNLLVSKNPIVEAAAEYAQAQKRVESILNKILQLKAQIADAETMNAEAIADRDMKKQVLQKLVAE